MIDNLDAILELHGKCEKLGVYLPEWLDAETLQSTMLDDVFTDLELLGVSIGEHHSSVRLLVHSDVYTMTYHVCADFDHTDATLDVKIELW